MRNAFLSSLFAAASIATLAVLPGCSSGSDSDSASLRIRCIGGEQFCLISCDLGCTQTGCAVTEIAENAKLHFKFSDAVDTQSVNSASLSIRTATGVAPDGIYLCRDNEVVFEPRVRTVNGVSTFGFQRNESYIVTIAGGDSAAIGIRNLSGDRLQHELSCTVRASLGIQDEDQAPPTAELISPPDTSAIPLDPTIVLRFSELIDTTPLQSPLSASSPIQVVLRSTLPSGGCDLDSEGIVLSGLPQLSTELVGTRLVTVVTFRPTVTLPGLSCVTVYVTSDVRDLSGRAAVPAQFQMFTQAGVSVDILITEPFANNSQQEELVSGGVWSGGARPGLIGGDGHHGSFSPSLGTSQGAGVFVWNLDAGITIPAGNTPSGQGYTVVDGQFFFTDFVLAAGTTVRFTGSIPPQFFVRGRCEIRGVLDCSGVDMPATVPTSGALAGQRASQYNAKGTPQTFQTLGQPGGLGGPGGGSGGNGGRECDGVTGPVFAGGINICDGLVGQTVKVQASHAYAGNVAGTGGLGSPLIPTSGLNTSASSPINASIPFRRDFSRGGGGGGFLLAGGTAALPTIAPGTAVQPVASPAASGGVPFALLPLPVSPPPGYQSLTHFLVGGSGGGGGGAHNFSTSTLLENAAGAFFLSGHGGTGGGGAIAVRSGGDLTLFAPSGAVLVRGGRGVVINGDNLVSTTQDIELGVSSPGGGGSGGSVLLQSARTVTVNGLLDASGDAGSRTSNINSTFTPTQQLNVISQAGAGSSGFYRVEGGVDVLFNGAVGTVPAYDPATNRGPLTDRDSASGDLAKWRGTNLVFPPTWLRYELDVDNDGDGTVDVTYTDSGEPGTQKANDPAGPVVILFQGAKMEQDGVTPIPGTIRPWREGIGTGAGPGIQQDSATGFRFTMTYNCAAFPNQVVRALRVYART